MEVRIHCVAVLSLLLPLACATPARTTRDVLVMEPLLVRTSTDPLTGLAGYDASQLMDVGSRHFERGDYEKAIRVYDQLLAVFPESAHGSAARYNAALASERRSDFEGARARYEAFVMDHEGDANGRDARFRLAFVFGKLARWKDVADTFWAIRRMGGLTPLEEIEARAGQGVGMFMQGDLATAEVEFMSAIRFFEAKSKDEFLPAEYWIGQSRFYLGEIHAKRFEEKRLSEPSGDEETWIASMGEDLEEKCQLLLRAQNEFIRAIRIGHAGWATASGYRIGALYEHLYEELVTIPVPPSLDDEAAAYYRGEVREKVSVLVAKAIKVYESSLDMAQRVGEKNEWVEKATASLERMKALYLRTSEG